MESRRIVDEKIKFQIKTGMDYTPRYFCTWEELMKVEGILPTDIVDDITYNETDWEGFGGDGEDSLKTIYVPVVVVIRPREETDEEYFSRMKEEELRRKNAEIKERNEYLRLKAKYENT